MIQALENKKPIIFGTYLHKSFEPDHDNIIPHPKSNEQTIGGHCLVATGIDMDNKLINFRNHWGTEWGDNGYARMTLADFLNPYLNFDLHTIDSIKYITT